MEPRSDVDRMTELSDFDRFLAKIRDWQQCPYTAKLTCSMDTDHPVLELRSVGGRYFLQCPEETCGFIRYDINPQVIAMHHGERHHGCYYVT